MREITKVVIDKLGVDEAEAAKIIEKAEIGGEINEKCPPQTWLNERLIPNSVVIDEVGYSRMCVDALKILRTTAATDYGASRQRDLGQLWADMTRGYLGELAFSLLMKQKWGIDARLGHEAGKLAEYLPTDIHLIRDQKKEYGAPRVRIGIKATKWNGIWLDIPGDQFRHSDIHVLVKVGTGRDHLFAFFKAISVFKDKVLQRGQDVGSLTAQESNQLFDSLPSFRPIPAYVCGFVRTDSPYRALDYTGRKGRIHYTIQSWSGPMNPGDLDAVKKQEGVSGRVAFEGIGRFAHDSGYLFNTGSLLWHEKDWDEFRSHL